MIVYTENNYLHYNEALNDELKKIFRDKKIEAVYGAKYEINWENLSINGNKMNHKFLFSSLNKKIPQYIDDNLLLNQSNFDLETLQNKSFPNIFACGSFLFPGCSL